MKEPMISGLPMWLIRSRKGKKWWISRRLKLVRNFKRKRRRRNRIRTRSLSRKMPNLHSLKLKRKLNRLRKWIHNWPNYHQEKDYWWPRGKGTKTKVLSRVLNILLRNLIPVMIKIIRLLQEYGRAEKSIKKTWTHLIYQRKGGHKSRKKGHLRISTWNRSQRK